MKKRIFSVVLACLLVVGLLTSCGQKTDSNESTKTSTVDGNTNAQDSSSSEQSTTEVVSVNGNVNLQTYPISKEKITLTLWYPMGGDMGKLADFNDAEFFQWYEEKTNIHIEFIIPAAGTEVDSFNLLFSSGDMPDMMYTQPAYHKYRGGEDKAIDDGFFVDLRDYIDCAPNYMSWVNNNETLKRAVYSDSGKMYGMWGMWKPMNGESCMGEAGLAIRQDFLDKVNKEIPTTYDEWYDVLVAFRDELNIEAPLYTTKYGIDTTGELMAGYGTAPYFYNDNGTVKFGPLDDQYKEYLELLHKWYQEGLLDKNFPTRNTSSVAPDSDMMLNDKVGACIDWATRLSDTYISRGASNPDFWLVAAPQPTKENGPIPKIRKVNGDDLMNDYCMVFSADSKYIEEAIRWTDGFYAEDIYLNANYGLENQEGVVWLKAEDGHRIGNYDFRYKNPDGMDSATVLVKYWVKNPPLRVEAAQIEQADENKQSAYKIWSQYEASWWMPSRITMTSDEATTFSSIYTDIETYVNESVVKFITGAQSLDTYDSFRNTLKEMGIEQAIALKQAGLDRYYNR